ncbi:MAG TPA: F0F1 ATP synthase subunit delta [Candidatus Saccharimonadales bacterium]|nr:F0F1 ATP synthase subunit delta [Candidatus Saccharimonadales bacterium]
MNSKVSRRVIARTVAAKLLAEPKQQAHWLKVTAAYLMEQRLVDDIDLFINDLASELYEQSGHLYVDVTSARKLTDTVRSELKHTLQNATGARHIELAEHIDPALLGGLIARTPTAELDASVRTKLKQLASL